MTPVHKKKERKTFLFLDIPLTILLQVSVSVWTNKEQGLHTGKSAGHFIILFSIKTCPQQH